MTTKPIVIAALAIAFSFAAHAGQGELSPLAPQQFKSTLDRGGVVAQARTPLQVNERSVGSSEPMVGKAERAQVRAGAVMIAHDRVNPYGDQAAQSAF